MYKKAIEAVERLTPDDIARIQGTPTVVFSGFPMKLTSHDLWTTKEGVDHQMEKFTGDAGFVYVAQVVDGRVDMAKFLVMRAIG